MKDTHSTIWVWVLELGWGQVCGGSGVFDSVLGSCVRHGLIALLFLVADDEHALTAYVLHLHSAYYTHVPFLSR